MMEQGAAVDHKGVELTGAHEGVDDVADARAGCEGGEEGLDLVFGGEDGLAEIEADEGREGGGLAGVAAGLDLLGEAGGGGLPEGGAAVGLGDGEHAEVAPELDEGAKDGGLGDLFAEVGDEIVGGEGAVLDEQGVGVEREGADLGGAGGGGWLLPGLVAAQGEDVGEDGGGDDEVGDVRAEVGAGGAGGCAEQAQGDGGAIADEAREQGAGGLSLGEGGIGGRGAEGGFDERGGGGGEELGAGGEEDEAGGLEPGSEALGGEEGVGGGRLWGLCGSAGFRG